LVTFPQFGIFGSSSTGGVRGGGQANNVFLRSYRAYSSAFFGKQEIDKGNKSKAFLTFASHLARISPARTG
jgi:hypothetical protein